MCLKTPWLKNPREGAKRRGSAEEIHGSRICSQPIGGPRKLNLSQKNQEFGGVRGVFIRPTTKNDNEKHPLGADSFHEVKTTEITEARIRETLNAARMRPSDALLTCVHLPCTDILNGAFRG